MEIGAEADGTTLTQDKSRSSMEARTCLSISLELVPPDEDSARLIMSWRNDPETLKQSFHSEAKVWPQFFREFKDDYFCDPALPCLFILADGARVGFLRFRRLAASLDRPLKMADISINIAPERRGQGVAAAAVRAALPVLRSAGIDRLVAELKASNDASAGMFVKAGFAPAGEANHLVVETEERVRIKRFICNLVCHVALPGTDRLIGPGYPCFVIAEAGSNWRMGEKGRDLLMARNLINAAAAAGADAVKFQTFRPETTYVANAGASDYLAAAGIKESITDIFADLAMPYEMISELSDYCRSRQVLFMSSAFSPADLQAVNPHVVAHKIASYEISHSRLIEAAARTGKPIILSTGASNLQDIRWAIDLIQSSGKSSICLMQCTASYPAPLSSLNLGAIAQLKAAFSVPVGLSDHSRDPVVAPVAAVALGANLIEKHFTLDNRLPGPDHAFAVTPTELKEMVTAIRKAEALSGGSAKAVLPEEEELFAYARRGIQAIADIEPGDLLIEGKNIDILRPGKQKRGIHPQHLTRLASCRATRKIRAGDGIQEGDFEHS